jgi:hypothetical protein
VDDVIKVVVSKWAHLVPEGAHFKVVEHRVPNKGDWALLDGAAILVHTNNCENNAWVLELVVTKQGGDNFISAFINAERKKAIKRLCELETLRKYYINFLASCLDAGLPPPFSEEEMQHAN